MVLVWVIHIRMAPKGIEIGVCVCMKTQNTLLCFILKTGEIYIYNLWFCIHKTHLGLSAVHKCLSIYCLQVCHLLMCFSSCNKQRLIFHLCFSWCMHVWNIMRVGICLPWFNYYNPDNSVNQFSSLWLLTGWKMPSLREVIVSRCEVVKKMMKMSCLLWQRIDPSVSLCSLQQPPNSHEGPNHWIAQQQKLWLQLYDEALKFTHMQSSIMWPLTKLLCWSELIHSAFSYKQQVLRYQI